MERVFKGRARITVAQMIAIAAASGLAFPGLAQTNAVRRDPYREQRERDARAAQHHSAEIQAWNEAVDRRKAEKKARRARAA